MMKSIELKKCLKNAILKSLQYHEPNHELTPKKYIDRVNLEYSIFDMKINLYQKCFSVLDNVFYVNPLFCFRGLNPIPRTIKKIGLKPIHFVFVDDLNIGMVNFDNIHYPNRISSIQGLTFYDRIYYISNFKFNHEFSSLIYKINFETHKLFLKENLDKLDLRPFINIHYNTNHYFCMGCGDIKHFKSMNPKDFLVCSIDCGMSIRGLSYRDFL